MRIKAVIWDVGGVLARTEDFTSRDALAQKWGMTRREIDEFVFHGHTGSDAQCGRISEADHWEALRQALKLDEAGILAFREQFFAGDVLDRDLVERIRSLRPRYKTGILSNAFSGLAQLLETWAIRDAFDAVAFSAQIGVMKPDPRSYQAALAALDVQPAEAVFIDDFQHNIDGARALGLHAIRFLNSNQAWQDLQNLLAQHE
jgi:epoxide hydrolase-like predicted phosphatase